MIAKVCDRCGKIYDYASKEKITVEVRKTIKVFKSTFFNDIEYELCDSCSEKLYEWIRCEKGDLE